MAEPRYFEDIDVGERATFGTYEVTEEEIVAFAERYDPQWFHTQPERARAESSFGDVIAPGWHTAAISQRLFADHYAPTIRNIAAKGADAVRWHRPVTPGTVLTCRTEVVDKEATHSDRGRVDIRIELYDQEETRVFGFVALVVVERQTAGERDDVEES